MKTLTDERLRILAENGYTVIHFYRFALVRKYSKFCTSNFWKKHCPIYCIVKKERNK